MSKEQSKMEKLESEGWERKFVADEPRLSEAVELYKQAGFEVHLEPLSAVEKSDAEDENCQECRICFEGIEDNYKVIFTRPHRGDE